MNLLVSRATAARAAALLALGAGLCTAVTAPMPAPLAITNSLGLEFIRVEAGSFTVGDAVGNSGPWNPNSGPVDTLNYDVGRKRRVQLSQPFYILKHQVARTEYARSGLAGSADDASWEQASAFCAWLSRQDGHQYRLPTEAEWERVLHDRPAEVDLGGRQWVLDWFGVVPPDDATDPAGPITGTTRVIRDGAQRASLPPDAAASPWGLSATGFRVVLLSGPETLSFGPPPFCQAAVKQSTAPARPGPDSKVPYFTVRFALPIPPENDAGLNGPLTGLDASVMAHQHSPGFEILPNGDVLAIYFSARNTQGGAESAEDTRFVQARLRYGAEEWDPPELFCDFKPMNDQSGLLWTEGNTVRFFGGGRGASAWLPFRMAASTNNGATWTMSLPLLDVPATDFTAQPIVSAFRAPNGAMYFAMDATQNASFLWRSTDNGIHWRDMGGRTAGRHSTIVPLDNHGRLLAIGGKSTSIDGWSPECTSADCGATWSAPVASPFPALASNQRPCLIRLADGHLCFVSDSYRRKTDGSPKGWAYGQGCFVAISSDNAQSWHIKPLPVQLPHENDHKHGTLGYATARQAPNGVIHVLATMTHPCLHYEFNEAWALSDAGDLPAENTGGKVKSYSEKYPSGRTRAEWSARTCPHGRYLLTGKETTFYENGRKEHEATYETGRKTGEETYWAPNGTKLWSWTHEPEQNGSTWVHYWNNGHKRIESHWNTRPTARDLDRAFFGLVANGPAYQWNQDGSPAAAYNFTNGQFAGTLPLPAAQTVASAGATGGRNR